MHLKLFLSLVVVAALFAFNASGKQFDYVPRNLKKKSSPVIINKTNPPPVVVESLAITNAINPEWLKLPSEPFTLGPGDKLEIEMLDEADVSQAAESRQVVTVAPDGKVYFSILPGLDVWGLTLTQTRDLLEKEFGKFFRDKPHVGVTLRAVESKRVWLLGRFQVPGVYPLASPMTLLEAITTAGGSMTYTSTGQQETTAASNTEELGDLRRAFVIRDGKLLPVNFERLLKQGDLSQNIYLQADDFIYLPAARAREVYVMGAVIQPRAVPYQDGMTLVTAIANAGGTHKESYWTHVAVVRGSLSEPQITVVNYRDIVHGHAPDMQLQPHDIVHVPLQPYRHLRRYADLILNTFVTSVAINEGARSATEETAPTGVLIPLGSTITVTPPPGATVPVR